MRRLLSSCCTLLLLGALLDAAMASLHAASVGRELITCGRDKVLILDLNSRDAAGTPKTIWSWRAADRAELPSDVRALFRSTDDCKPVDGGRRILITSSSGGVALVERASGAVVFYGRAVNAHSADLLPNGRIAVAASHAAKGDKGDALILFDVKQSDHELWRTELPVAHGAVWDEARQILWALASQELRGYRLVDWTTATPRLALFTSVPLPEKGGHDLQAVPHTSSLSISTEHHCWIFDRGKGALLPHPALGARAGIKCISVHPVTGQIAFTEAELPNWWTTTIRFLEPAETCSVPGEQFYKVRWNASTP